ncbi:MAG TPA: DUF4097 family beta strand repeat-containing protein [Pyrinomonadaceae bacterium]|nr:DUF4097 family beta strand repeat-containing protein [Pyrinomonadaceae bacterium]
MTRSRMFAGVLTLTLALAAQTFGACALARSGGAPSIVFDDGNYTERDESRQSYPLAPGARVELNSVSGHVTVETGGSAADVHIVRSARSREDLRCREFKVTATETGLRIDGNDNRRECRNVQVRQTVNLRLPRSVNLDVNSVSGHVTVGGIDGSVKMNSISGHATVRQAAGEAIFNSISGHVSVNLSSLGGRGVRMSSISGNIEVGLPENANADWSVTSISGNVIADAPGVTVQKVGPSSYEGRIGSGGTEMTFSSISGNVRFRRTSD